LTRPSPEESSVWATLAPRIASFFFRHFEPLQGNPSVASRVLPSTGSTSSFDIGATALPSYRPSFLRLESDPDDPIGGGQTTLLSGGTWSYWLADYGGNGALDTVTVTRVGSAEDPLDRWSTSFTTASMSQGLTVGTYENARRFPTPPPGFPGLDVSGQGRTCGEITGAFAVTEFLTDRSRGYLRLGRFRATFEQHCTIGPAALRGEVFYAAPPVPTILNATYSAANGTVTAQVVDFGKGKAVVDGSSVPVMSRSGKAVTLQVGRLSRGPHAISLRSRDEIASPSYVLVVEN
jgi:hypothetical protein